MWNRQQQRLLTMLVFGGVLTLLLFLSDLRSPGVRTSGGLTESGVGPSLAQDSPVSGAATPSGASRAMPDMIVVPAGVLATTAAPVGGATEGQKVFVAAFALHRTEVTNAAFAEFARRTGFRTLAEQAGDPRTWRTAAQPSMAEHPVTYIAWADANAYCEEAGLRLPTELEWERAARGDDGRLWPWGNEWDGSRLNSLERGAAGPAPVGSDPHGASPYGLLDMAGNVWEWTSSPYLIGSTMEAPDAQSLQTFRGHLVLRGGSWRTMAAGTQTTYRKPAPPEYRRDTTGFRCAADPASIKREE
jgi:serine/threonine-protein kinase